MSQTFERSRILITGGSGFIGTHLVRALVAQGATVLNVDRRLTSNDARVQEQPVDLLDRPALQKAFSEFAPTAVLNLAAETDIERSPAAFKVNTLGLEHVAACVQQFAPSAKLIHFSTQLVVQPGHEPKADDDLMPYTVYGESKAEAERWLRGNGQDFDWTIVRPTTVWGPGHPTFSRSIWRYLRKRYYMLPAGADPIRSYGYVDNVVFQTMRLLELPAENTRHMTYYVGDEPVRSSQWLDAFSVALSGKPVRRIPFALLRGLALAGEGAKKLKLPSPINLGRLYRMTSDYPVPMERTFRDLGRGPVSLMEGVNRTKAWLESDGAA